MKAIQLYEDDDIISVCDLLEWSGESQLLLILPEGAELLGRSTNLVRLRRFADRQRKEVGLVTNDTGIRRQALALGLPAFRSVEDGQRNRRRWWRGRRRSERVGLPTKGESILSPRDQSTFDSDDESETYAISGRHWLFRYVAILLFFASVAFAVVAFAYTLPRATITFRPQVIPISDTVQIVADPVQSDVDYEQSTMPARTLKVDKAWQSELETTGTVVVPQAPARGHVVFLNLTDESVEVPAGTRLRNEDGDTGFQTIDDLTMVDVISSTAEVDVVALRPGPEANVPADTVTRIDGDLSERLLVTNPAPMTGGAVREVSAVTAEDMERLRSVVLQFLQALALGEMEALMTEREFLARDSLQVVAITREEYSHGIGQQTNALRLKMEASLRATAVDLTAASGFVYEALSAKVADDYTLVADSINYRQEEVLSVDEHGRVAFLASGEGLMAADLYLEEMLPSVAGQPPEIAMAYLYKRLPLRDVPAIDVWPGWFQRLPFVDGRITAEVETGE